MQNYKTLLVGCVSAVVIGAATWLYAGFGGKAHLMDQPCGNCHISGKEVAPAGASRLIGSQEMLCGICHKNVRRLSHPSGIVPKGKIPTELPLDWKGDLTCSTCHEVHGNQPGLMRGKLRGKALCLACHEKQFFAAMKDGGRSLQQSGHAAPSAAQSKMSVGIDALSLQCMGCHNQQNDVAGVRVGGSGVVRHDSGGANHPIGIAYPVFSVGNALRPISSLPKFITLPEGKLSCVSCHEPYKQKHGQLVMPNGNSSLCTQCHNL